MIDHIEIPDAPPPVSESLTKRAVWWSMFFSQLLITKSELRDIFPGGTEVYVLPSRDPELISHNIALANRARTRGRPVVFASLEFGTANEELTVTPLRSDGSTTYAVG